MRTTVNGYIWNIWTQGGPFVGDDFAAHGRVTVEPGWQLQESGNSTIGTFTHGPIRWFQRSNNNQVETEIPNIMTIDIDRQLSNDAATCKIVMLNTKMETNNVAAMAALAGESVGQPGYYWSGRGDSVTDLTRWGQTTNTWNGVIQPNALIRTYQGYGGRTKTIDQALQDGNILQTGLWLVDDVSMDAQTGLMTISCRDMAKLVIQQTLYPPLAPGGGTQTPDMAINGPVKYPLYYYRFVYLNHPVIPYGTTVYHSGWVPLAGQNVVSGTAGTASPLRNPFSSTDSPGSPDNGHTRGDAIDGDPDTYWLSNGHMSSAGQNNFEFLQFDVGAGGAAINAINIQPFAGNYIMYISIKEVGQTGWTGAATIPYIPGAYTGTYAMNIPYIYRVGVGWEQPQTIDISKPDGSTYNVETIRLSFTHLAKTGPTPLPYRCGVRELEVGNLTTTVTGGGRTIVGIVAVEEGNPNGYWMAGSDGNVFGFGSHTRTYGDEGGDVFNAPMTGMSGHPATGAGYRLLGADGGVFDFGDCNYLGSLPDINVILGWNTGGASAVDIQNGGQGSTGYYILTSDGRVYTFGTAVYYGNYSGITPDTPATSLASATSMAVIPGGYWITNGLGQVQAFGSAVGVVTAAQPSDGGGPISAIEPTGSGQGYWMVSTLGHVYARGNAVNVGDARGSSLGGLIVDITHATFNVAGVNFDAGYWLVGQDGGVFTYAYPNGPGIQFSGSLPEQFFEVGDGNYCVDPETEILTKRGWLTYDQIEVGADVALAINPDTGRSDWEEIYDIYVGERSGEMVLMDGKGHSSLTTPDHRWLTEYRGQKRWVTSETMTDLDKVPICAPLNLPTVPTFSDEFVELVGWMWTEGYFGRPYRPTGGTTQISQSDKVNADYVKRIQRCLRSLYGEPGRGASSLRGKNAAKWRDDYVMSNGVRLFRLGREVSSDLWRWCPNKILSLEFLHLLTQQQLDLLVETSLAADGHVKSTASTLTQHSREAAEAFQIACILSGRAAILTERSTVDMWEVSVKKRTTCSPVRTARSVESFKLERVPYEGIVWCPTLKHHNWLARRNGKVYYTGNSDYADIINDMLLWCGWWFFNPALGDSTPALPVFGNIEQTGIYAPDNLTEDFFDQNTVIDVINTLKEIVGYITYADEIGAYHFQSPNVWSIGNFLDTGVPTAAMAAIDERLQITAYTVDINDTDARSTIIIGTEDPALKVPGTQSVSITSQWGPEVLRGLVVPALWVNGQFLTSEVQTTMAHLIDLHLYMQQRQGSLTMAANPVIQIDDQVQIYERSTSETYVHYVSGYSTHMDLQTGEYTEVLTTHWMGDGNSWFLVYDDPQPVNESPLSGNIAPQFVAAGPPDTGNVSIYYEYEFVASGSPPPTYSVSSGAIPTGLYLNATTGLLSGEPTTAGTFTFVITASNGIGSPAVSTTRTVTISGVPISDPPPPPSGTGSAPTLVNESPPAATVNTSYAYTFTATGSPDPTFAVSAGTLPPGLVLASNGVLSGIPTASGTYNFAVTASNGNGSDSTSLTLMTGGGGGGGTPTSGIYWGARIQGQFENDYFVTGNNDDAPWAAGDPHPNNWDVFEEHAGKAITCVWWGGQDANGIYAFDQTGESFARSRGAFSLYSVGGSTQDLIDLANNSNSNGVITRVNTLASGMAAAGHPIMIRPWWEMNFSGVWNWDGGNVSSSTYVAAWRNLYTLMNAIASNISFLWCPNATPSGFGIPDPSPWFPGVNYVDWTGFDGYTHVGESTTPETLFNSIYATCQSVAPGKPMAIGEMGASATMSGEGKTAWVADFLGTWLPEHPDVKMFIWFNSYGDPPDGEIELGPGSTVSGASQAAFSSGIANGYFLDNIVDTTTFPNNNKVPIPGGGMVVGGGTMTPPAFVDDTPPNGTVGVSYTYDFTAVGDPDPTFSHTGTLPTGLTLSSSGILAGVPTTAATYGSFTVQATNGDGGPVSVSPVILITSGGGGGNSNPPPAGGFFTLSAPGASLPGGLSVASADAAAAALVVPSTWEPRPQNNTANNTIAPQPNTLANFPELNGTWNSTYLPRISGNFSGTTDEIIQWAAAKWGLSDETIRAECVTESTWVQANQGDFEPRSNNHFVFDISADPCPTSFGIIQVKWYFHPPIVSEGGTVTSSSDSTSSYPYIRLSTAYCLDIYAAMIRGIYEGMSTYLGATTGDIWGAIGSWYSGDWHSAAADNYITNVQTELANKRWLQTGF